MNKSGNFYTRMVSSLLFPVHEWLRGHSSATLRKLMEESQWWDSDRLRAFQLVQLRALLTHAAEQVPYYRRLFRKIGMDPKDIRSLTDLEQLPFLNKDLIRNYFEEFKADDAHGLSRFNTGGSTGQPLIFLVGKERFSYDVAAKWRATRWWGVDIGDPEIVLWGSPIELNTQDRLRQLRDRLFRTRLLPAFEMSPAQLDQFVTVIRAMRPKMLFGYPSALAHLARHIEARGQVIHDLGIEVAFVTAEKLYETQREQIERLFACRVANGYGGRDAGFIAHECPAGGMHITAENIILEIVDNEGHVLPPGEVGEIVVTNLGTKDSPFIRYRTGDIGVLDEKTCSCGRGLPLLKEIQGRNTDFVIAADGTVVHALALIYVIRSLHGIDEFKLLQHTLSRVEVLVVPNRYWVDETEVRLMAGIQTRLGREVQVQVRLMDAIKPETSGKHRYVVSHVPLPSPSNAAVSF